jgi:hypothetical protein
VEWLSANWVWILIGIAFVAMHMFGHGSHGGDNEKTGSDPSRKREEDARAGHQH